MLSVGKVREYIDYDKSSQRKQLLRLGRDYYEAKHDILKYEVYYVDENGIPVKDRIRSNIRISHAFFTEIVDQCADYMIGNERFVTSEDQTLDEQLAKYFDDEFTAEVKEWVRGMSYKGWEYLYAYKRNFPDGERLAFACADSEGVVEVRAEDADDDCDHFIYWYDDRVDFGRKEVTRVQVWDENEVWYYVSVDKGELKLDPSEKVNPRPHVMWTEGNDDTTFYEGLGIIPFFRLDNNRKQVSDLAPIKDLIDDYDLMACSLSNNLEDFTEGMYVVKGFDGDDLGELIYNLRNKKAIGVDDDGDVDIRTVDIPYEARKVKLELDEKNIYRFGMGLNSAMVGDGNVTNVVIKSRYALLDMKANKKESRLRAALKNVIQMVLDEINASGNHAYTMQDVKIEFAREVITNELDNAQIELTDAQTEQTKVNTLLNVASTLGNEGILEALCDILELDYATIKASLPEDPTLDLVASGNALASIPAEDGVNEDEFLG